MNKIKNIISRQKDFFNSNKTKEVRFRMEQLKKIKSLIKANEDKLFKAIYEDFGKSEFETYVTELSLLYHEIDIFIRKVPKWSRKKKVSTGLVNFPAKSYIIPEPLGTSLVIGAWNYPYQLSLLPAVTAIAAGNTVVLKPSELPSRTSAEMADLINNHFPKEFFHVIEGGVAETTELLAHHFDKIFFTGSIPVGKVVYQAAAKHLTPVTLELGGKSPVFVLPDAHLKIAAKRIVWAKFINAGQTCVAPDYILVHESVQDAFIEALKNELEIYPKTTGTKAGHYLKIINERNFDRLEKLMDEEKICCGGAREREQRFISPTVLKDVSFDDDIMQDEIFGPLLPLVPFTDLDDAIAKVKARPKPLSCYVYSGKRSTINKILREVSFGGGAVNESLMHLSNSKLPFGGVGFSGMGSYHGKAGFDAFTHYKSILDKPSWFEAKIKYPPYSLKKLKLIKFMME